MKKSRLIYIPLLFAVLFAAVFIIVNHDQAVGQMTIPTRTPKPDNPEPPPEPTDDDGDNGGGGNNGGGGDNGSSQPDPTNTPLPTATSAPIILPTNTPTATIFVSPTRNATATGTPPTETVEPTATATTDFSEQLGQIAPGSTPVEFPILATAYPTAEPCAEPPTFITLTTANVYGGPGSDYPVVETLDSNEVRPIVGRAGFATWWLIQLDGKYKQGWISDKAGSVQGYTGNVPIIEAPAINGALPTPGSEWEPTPVPACTPTPTPTSDGSVISGSIIDYDGTASEKVKPAAGSEEASVQRSELAESAAPLELEVAPAAPTPNLLPIAGLVLVIAAIFVGLFLRRSTGGGDASS